VFEITAEELAQSAKYEVDDYQRVLATNSRPKVSSCTVELCNVPYENNDTVLFVIILYFFALHLLR
jgi:hypothetical protein